MRTIKQYIKESKSGVILTSTPINGYSMRIRAQWTPEMIQDISAFHNIDAEAELLRVMDEELTRSIGNEIIRNLLNNDLH